MTAIFHYSMQLSMIVFAPHIGAELDWLQLTEVAYCERLVRELVLGSLHNEILYVGLPAS